MGGCAVGDQTCIAGYCALAASGRAAAPPRSMIKSRRLIRRECWTVGDVDGDLTAHPVGGKRGQSIMMALRPAVFDRDIPVLDMAGFAQAKEPTADWRLTIEP